VLYSSRTKGKTVKDGSFALVTVPLLFLLAGCVFPGTGTLHIRNEMTACRPITALYLYEKGDPDKGSSIISSPMCPNESHTEWGVIPGDYTIEAEMKPPLETKQLTRGLTISFISMTAIYNKLFSSGSITLG